MSWNLGTQKKKPKNKNINHSGNLIIKITEQSYRCHKNQHKIPKHLPKMCFHRVKRHEHGLLTTFSKVTHILHGTKAQSLETRK